MSLGRFQPAQGGHRLTSPGRITRPWAEKRPIGSASTVERRAVMIHRFWGIFPAPQSARDAFASRLTGA